MGVGIWFAAHRIVITSPTAGSLVAISEAPDEWHPVRLRGCDASDEEEGAVPIVHACSREGCATLTMGTLCLDHEREQEGGDRQRRLEGRALRLLAPVAPAAALLAAVVAGVVLKTRLS